MASSCFARGLKNTQGSDVHADGATIFNAHRRLFSDIASSSGSLRPSQPASRRHASYKAGAPCCASLASRRWLGTCSLGVVLAGSLLRIPPALVHRRRCRQGPRRSRHRLAPPPVLAWAGPRHQSSPLPNYSSWCWAFCTVLSRRTRGNEWLEQQFLDESKCERSIKA